MSADASVSSTYDIEVELLSDAPDSPTTETVSLIAETKPEHTTNVRILKQYIVFSCSS